jgi:hypothetical protein
MSWKENNYDKTWTQHSKKKTKHGSDPKDASLSVDYDDGPKGPLVPS